MALSYKEAQQKRKELKEILFNEILDYLEARIDQMLIKQHNFISFKPQKNHMFSDIDGDFVVRNKEVSESLDIFSVYIYEWFINVWNELKETYRKKGIELRYDLVGNKGAFRDTRLLRIHHLW